MPKRFFWGYFHLLFSCIICVLKGSNCLKNTNNESLIFVGEKNTHNNSETVFPQTKAIKMQRSGRDAVGGDSGEGRGGDAGKDAVGGDGEGRGGDAGGGGGGDEMEEVEEEMLKEVEEEIEEEMLVETPR